ncbi:protein of unknown function [Natronorubrum texcoconense]|uniref:DUF4399 domain-containing protein n=1 Tax=Natronorubrum texcoconense TaxID=1095776 RepID=A0A1G8V7B3_9EURY|nr:protein of unknown function [Natronorubrum texcoconense]
MALAGCSDLIEDYDEDDGPEEENGDGEQVEDVDHENPEGELEVVSPDDGDEVTSPVEIEMDVEDFELQAVEDDDGDDDEADAPDDGAGHLHVIVDEGCVDPGYLIPLEDGYHHLSEGETETELDLEPGEYDLCAQAGDDQHNAYDMTDELSIEIVEEDADTDDESETDDDGGTGTGDGDDDGNDEN